MSERLEAMSEVVKLGRLLGVPEAELAFLEEVPSAELRAFREAATNRMFDSGSKLFERVGAAARLVPAAAIATIAQRAFGPLLCARAASAVDTAKAIDVAGRLPPEFLADTAIELDPRRVAPIIAGIPERTIVSVASELGRRREYVTMGRFLAFVPDGAIVGAMEVLDDEALLRTAFVLEHKDRLDDAIGLLPEARLDGVVYAATELELWPETLDLLGHLSDSRRRRLASAPAFHEPEVMAAIVRTAASQGLWVELVPLITALPAEAQASLPAIAAALEHELLAGVVRDAAAAPDTLPTLLAIVRDVDPAARAGVVSVIDEADRGLAEELVDAFGDPAAAGPLLDLLTPDLLDAVERAALRFGMDDVLARAREGAG